MIWGTQVLRRDILYLNEGIGAELLEVYLSVLGNTDMETSPHPIHLLSLVPVPPSIGIGHHCLCCCLQHSRLPLDAQHSLSMLPLIAFNSVWVFFLFVLSFAPCILIPSAGCLAPWLDLPQSQPGWDLIKSQTDSWYEVGCPSLSCVPDWGWCIKTQFQR